MRSISLIADDSGASAPAAFGPRAPAAGVELIRSA